MLSRNSILGILFFVVMGCVPTYVPPIDPYEESNPEYQKASAEISPLLPRLQSPKGFSYSTPTFKLI